MKPGLSLLTLMLALCACSTSRVTPVAPHVIPKAADIELICIIENPRVARPEFVDSYRLALEQRGYKVQVLRDRRAYSLKTCPVLTEYTANWHWDMVVYLRYAELRIYKDGKPAGRAVFNARSSRFINEEETLRRLVEEMLPK